MSKYDDYFSIDDLDEEYQKLEIEFIKSDDPTKKCMLLEELCLIEDAIDDKLSLEDF
ncbi:hypothetical protein [Cysteiniphilum litorale]|uniref:hypothetical protein n=1 Tax=Cysteiniphilum litorale TaxID=2056700 RepID=UPI003F8825F4